MEGGSKKTAPSRSAGSAVRCDRPKALSYPTRRDTMRRRTLLAVVATALAGSAGCGSLSSDGGGTTETTSNQSPASAVTATETSNATTEDLPSFDTDEVQRQLSVESVDSVPEEHPVAIDVELLNGAVTGESPARVRATVTNTADGERRLTQNEGDCALFDRGEGASESPGLYLHRPGFPGFAQDCRDPSRVGNLWRFDLSADATCAVQAYGCRPVTYAAGESRSETYRVWDDYDAPGYMPPGTYRFATTVAIGPQDDAEEFEWGFSLAVEGPD